MDGPESFDFPAYLLYLVLLGFTRGADFLSTWIATPNLVLEANPIAKALRWKGSLVINLIMCLAFAAWPLPAIIICTSSALVAARNFQLAWVMRAAGEENYRLWTLARLQETPVTLFLFCLFAQTLLISTVGGTLIVVGSAQLVTLGIGIGIVGYAMAVLVFTMFSLWRYRRALG